MFHDGFFLYVLVMAGVTYLVRMLPLVLCKKAITNRFLLSFLHYVPYAVLTVMTVPACFFATDHLAAGIVGFAAAFILSFRKTGLIVVAAGSAAAALITECFILYILPPL